MIIKVTRIGGDGSIRRAVGDAAGRDDAARWEQLAPWSAAAARPRPAPGDRASFFFRPIELLGIALGVAAIADSETTSSHAGLRSWIDLLL
jgi:hypothetical protein